MDCWSRCCHRRCCCSCKQCSKLHVSNSSSFICRASLQWVFILSLIVVVIVIIHVRFTCLFCIYFTLRIFKCMDAMWYSLGINVGVLIPLASELHFTHSLFDFGLNIIQLQWRRNHKRMIWMMKNQDICLLHSQRWWFAFFFSASERMDLEMKRTSKKQNKCKIKKRDDRHWILCRRREQTSTDEHNEIISETIHKFQCARLKRFRARRMHFHCCCYIAERVGFVFHFF